MSLWADKYRPRTLTALNIHKDINESLIKLAKTGDMPHILFFGPPGAGKRSRIQAFLREIYGAGVDKIKMVEREIQTKSRTIEIPSVQSSYHIEINPSDAGNYDTFVIQDVIKEIAMTQSVSAAARMMSQKKTKADDMSDSTAPLDIPAYKVVVLHEVDKLSSDAQHGLRRTMEQYTSSCRLILCAESASRVTAPLKSRCLLMRIPSPNNQDIYSVIANVANKQKITVPKAFVERLISVSDNCMRRALLAFQASVVKHGTLTDSTPVSEPEWESMIRDLGVLIAGTPEPSDIVRTRAVLTQLVLNCIPPDVILQHLANSICNNVSEPVQHQIVRWRAFYDERLFTGSKPVIHLEAFAIKAMSCVSIWNSSTDSIKQEQYAKYQNKP